MNLVQEIPFRIPIKEIVLKRGLLPKAAQIMADYGNCHIICDENTQHFITKTKKTTILAGNSKALLSLAQNLAKQQYEVFVAVGSGTINDIVKYAAFLAGKPYIIFGTAPSMNGYASGNASLLENGYKKTFSAKPPLAVYLDLEVLENAPRRLINAGIGDSICRPSIEADLKLSKQILGTPNFAEYLSLIKKYEAEIFESTEALAKTLIFSGVAMLLAGSSAPSSQSEHMIAHAMELCFPHAPHSFHGEQIAVTTITMLEVIANSTAEFLLQSFAEKELEKNFGAENTKYFAAQYEKKFSAIAGKKIMINKAEFERFLSGKEDLTKKLKAINCPTAPEQIGWEKNKYNEILPLVKFTRDRFTFLDALC